MTISEHDLDLLMRPDLSPTKKAYILRQYKKKFITSSYYSPTIQILYDKECNAFPVGTAASDLGIEIYNKDNIHENGYDGLLIKELNSDGPYFVLSDDYSFEYNRWIVARLLYCYLRYAKSEKEIYFGIKSRSISDTGIDLELKQYSIQFALDLLAPEDLFYTLYNQYKDYDENTRIRNITQELGIPRTAYKLRWQQLGLV